MSGKHVDQAAWRPRRLAPVLTLLAGFGTWTALAAALVLLPSTTPADVHGSLSGPAHDRDDSSVVPPQTLRTGPSSPADATPSDDATGVSRDARRTAGQDTATTGAAAPTTSEPTSDPTTDPAPTDPGPSQTSPPGHANGHDDDNPGKGHGPHGKP